jgi:hypothetical protein
VILFEKERHPNYTRFQIVFLEYYAQGFFEELDA